MIELYVLQECKVGFTLENSVTHYINKIKDKNPRLLKFKTKYLIQSNIHL